MAPKMLTTRSNVRSFSSCKIGRIALLKLAVREALAPLHACSPPRPGCSRYRLPTRLLRVLAAGKCRRSVAASEIQYLEPLRDSESFHERLSALPHALGNSSEVAFFPQRLVWIHRTTPRRLLVPPGPNFTAPEVTWRERLGDEFGEALLETKRRELHRRVAGTITERFAAWPPRRRTASAQPWGTSGEPAAFR